MVATNHYRWDFIGLSTDAKPTAENPKVVDGSTYYESDTSKAYVWYKDQWYEKTATGGGGYELPVASASTLGGVKVGEGLSIDAGGVLSASGGGGGETIKTLTADDYNWNSSTQSATEPYNAVALWLLDAGFYTKTSGVNVFVHRNSQLSTSDIAFVGKYNSSFGVIPVATIYAIATSEAGFEYCTFYSVLRNFGTSTGSATLSQVIDDLSSDYTNAPLSAKQGRILAERSNIIETTAPDTATEGVLGQLYTDTTNMHTYQCTAIDDSGDEPVYTWTQRW